MGLFKTQKNIWICNLLYLTPLSPVSQIDGIGGRGLPTAPPPPFAWSCSATRERKRLEHTLQLGLRHRVY
jgi:hypothetical protein